MKTLLAWLGGTFGLAILAAIAGFHFELTLNSPKSFDDIRNAVHIAIGFTTTEGWREYFVANADGKKDIRQAHLTLQRFSSGRRVTGELLDEGNPPQWQVSGFADTDNWVLTHWRDTGGVATYYLSYSQRQDYGTVMFGYRRVLDCVDTNCTRTQVLICPAVFVKDEAVEKFHLTIAEAVKDFPFIDQQCTPEHLPTSP